MGGGIGILRPMTALRVSARRWQQQPRQGLTDDVTDL